MTRQFRREKQGKNGHILGKIWQCVLQSVAIFAGDKTSHKCLEQLFLFAESNWAAIEEEEQNNENNGSPTLRGKISSDLSIVFVIGNFTTSRC